MNQGSGLKADLIVGVAGDCKPVEHEELLVGLVAVAHGELVAPPGGARPLSLKGGEGEEAELNTPALVGR